MNAGKLTGKTVKRVYQYLTAADPARTREWAISAIEFTDGSVLRFHTIELGHDYAVAGVYPARDINADDRVRYVK